MISLIPITDQMETWSSMIYFFRKIKGKEERKKNNLKGKGSNGYNKSKKNNGEGNNNKKEREDWWNKINKNE